jgi:hypothetical protein
MNKRGQMEMFNVLIAAAVIATVFFIFYTWYGVAGGAAIDKINEQSSDLAQNHALLNLLNTPAGIDATISDFIVTNNPKTASVIDATMKKVHGSIISYRLVYDGNVIAETPVQPLSPTEQSAVLPTPFSTPKNIVLRFGI